MATRSRRVPASAPAKRAGAAPRKRRTQSERSAATREKVIQAVVDCIVEGGLANTTAARISERAGVTWGAIVHQFGDKDSVLLAVMERSFADLSRSLSEAMAKGPKTPRERVSLLLDETWRRLNTPQFHAFLEIILSNRSASGGTLKARQEELVVTLSRGIWQQLFGELDIDPEAIETARKLTFATLLGMAIQGMLGPRKPRFTRELDTLKQGVLGMLGFAGA